MSKLNNNSWISVNDMLPIQGKDVLIYMGEINQCSVGSYTKDDGWQGHYDSGWIDDVTHWQPLPNPPKK